MTIRQKIFEIVQPDRGQSPASRIFDWTITILILLSVVSVFIITFDLPRPFMRSLFIFEQVASAIFTIEYILRLATADLLYPESGAIRARVRYFFSPMALIDLAAILPFWLPMFLPCSMLALRALWLFRLLRIFKLNRYCEALSSVGEVLAERKRELLGSLFSVVLMMLVSSLLMYSAEHDAQPEVFRNAFSGLWWAVCTVTTIGYGDIYPVTVVGRLLGAFIAISGIAALAIPTGIVSAGLTERLSREARVEQELRRQRNVDDAHGEELARQRGKDDDHDRILREHGELLKAISEKLDKLSSH
ncbi:MAG: ion transporter [Kiritimatiellae bacterium]|nr:ion transporter [Kiritimatiellia bacterium]